MSAQTNPSSRLITISISHFCEKARWALHRLAIPYIEERHVPLLHRLATSQSGGGTTVPVLVTEAGVFSDSTDILNYLDTLAPAAKKLYPADANLRGEVEKLEDLFDTQLGPSTRVWFYFYLLDNRELMLKIFCDGVEPLEQQVFAIVFPCIEAAMRPWMNITAESATAAQEKIKRIFEEVSGMLADGRTYLVGDSFSAADLTFACLAAPAVWPSEYGTWLPELSEIPGEMQATIEALRETPAGKYALRLFRDERLQ
ncbi:glutathione S-transferase family protein [Kamptonema formosum]|uniref:glutathione S-transferase family protein n=1 Tax=Kamptonema formosum TaxID=331992 RepID=UPI00034C2DE0|nr:glutathione S-transferase family protein [Oscillatoria sp. PCC 10802]